MCSLPSPWFGGEVAFTFFLVFIIIDSEAIMFVLKEIVL
jgi:hypothetical protein